MQLKNNYINSDYQKIFNNGYLENNNYNNALVSPHILFENFFNEDILNSILNEFPNMEKEFGNFFNNRNSKVYTTFSKTNFENLNYTKKFIDFLNSKPFIDFLQKLTGIREELFGDSDMLGGGLHEYKRGGYLKLHSDFYLHPKLKLDRRINILIYLNKNYKPQEKGEIYLFNKDLKSYVKYSPKFNSLFIFNTTKYSYHGVPDPIEMDSRKSIALYFYSKGRPKNEKDIYRRLNTTYWVNQNNNDNVETSGSNLIKKFLKKNIPSFLLDLVK